MALTQGPDAARQPFETEQLLVSGGWQPDLTLWHMAGGPEVLLTHRKCKP